MEEILKIEELSTDYEDGFVITTDKQIIKLLMENGLQCCENYGYFMSEDNLDNFIGAKIRSIYTTDIALKTYEILDLDYLDFGDVLFVNIDTTKGLLQFTAYNAHNGYYGHRVRIESQQLSLETTL